MNLDEQARQILRDNDRGGYTVPTSGLYPYQWNWDSAFAAWGFSTFDIDRAWVELETLVSTQWPTGMVPHIIFWKPDPSYFPGPDIWGGVHEPPSSGISQPPVVAILARLIHSADPDAGLPRLKEMWPKLLAWHRWWHRYRCPNGLATITHPWESGRDNCADWDGAMSRVKVAEVGEYTRRDTGHVDPSMRPTKEDYDRYLTLVKFGRDCRWDQDQVLGNGPFLVADPAMHFILMRAHRDLAEIGRMLGEDVAELDGYVAEKEAALPEIWNEDLQAYDARDLRTGEFSGTLGSGSFLAWLAGVENEALEQRLMAAWDAVPYGIPSTDPHAPTFDAKKYWRGPSWPFLNALIAVGLKDAGREELAARLKRETAALIEGSGFWEYYDPTDGAPCGGPVFTWTAAIWLTWASPTASGDL